MKWPTTLHDFLAEQTTLTLGTLNPDLSPYLCDVFFAHDLALSFFFLSDPRTQHAQNLTRTSKVSATVHQAVTDWQAIRGVQMMGEAMRVNEAERERGFEMYVAKFPFVREWLPSVEALGQLHKRFGIIELYKIMPRWLRWIDNTQGFGHKEEFEIH